MKVGTPLEARRFLMSLSVPYQLKPFVECPIRGRCTLAFFWRGEEEEIEMLQILDILARFLLLRGFVPLLFLAAT